MGGFRAAQINVIAATQSWERGVREREIFYITSHHQVGEKEGNNLTHYLVLTTAPPAHLLFVTRSWERGWGTGGEERGLGLR